jgi:hypothetical protein
MAINPPDLQWSMAQTKRNHFFRGFLVVLLNNFMKRDQTELWLKDNGLRSAYFARIPLPQAQAVSAAHNLLKQRVGLLSAEQTLVLQLFCRANRSARTRARITEAQCFEILKITKQANRSLFKEHRQLKRETKRQERNRQERQAPQR